MNKICINCENFKSLDDFRRKNNSIDGHMSICKECCYQVPYTRERVYNDHNVLIKIACNVCHQLLPLTNFSRQGINAKKEIIYHPSCQNCLKTKKENKRQAFKIAMELAKKKDAESTEQNRRQEISKKLSEYYQTAEGKENKTQAHQKRSATMSQKKFLATEKKCRMCKVTKKSDQFCKKAAAVDGLQSYCKPCTNIKKQKLKNKDSD